jgi:hypothetical protein
MNMNKFYDAVRSLPARLEALENEFAVHKQQLASGVFNGKDGRPGVDGRNGRDGKDGQRGAAGERGATGAQGPAGRDGTNAQNVPVPGPQGPQGPQGVPGNDTALLLEVRTMLQGFYDMNTKAANYLAFLKAQVAKNGK